jgi:hypothetical protein
MLLSKVERAAAEAATAARAELAAALEERRNCSRDMQRLHAQLAIETHEQSFRLAASCLVTVATPTIFYKVLEPSLCIFVSLALMPDSPSLTTSQLNRLWRQGRRNRHMSSALL